MRIRNPDLLNEYRSRGPCEACGKPCGAREPAHLISRGAGGSDIAINLIALGSTQLSIYPGTCKCHRSHHDGNQPYTEELRAIIARREHTSPDDIIAVEQMIRCQLPKQPPMGVIEALIYSLPVSAQKLAWDTLSEAP